MTEKNRWLTLVAVLAAAIAFLLLVSGGHTQEEEPPRFGVVEAFWAPEQAARLGVDWERILFYWSEVQPEGPESWNTLHVMEEWLAEGEAHNREIVGLIKHTPEWASDGPLYTGVPRGLYLPVDDPENLWANFVRRLAAYYGERGVHRWIIWNEPDIEAGIYGNEWAGSVEEYYRLVKVAYLVMKEEDPEAVIHLAGLTYWHDVEAQRELYLQRFLEVAAADPEAPAHNWFFDVLSLHIYFRVETVPQIVEEIDDIQQSFGLDKPIWINETNAAPTMDPLWPVERPRFQVDLDQQAWYIVQAHALGFARGVESIGVYKFSDVLEAPGTESFGLLRADYSERPAFLAHQTVIQALRGFTAVDRQQTDDYELLTFTRPQGTTRILWARNEETLAVAVPALAEQATLLSATGEATVLEAEEGKYRLTLGGARCWEEMCIIGGPPLLLLEEGVTEVAAVAAPEVLQARRTTPMPPSAIPGQESAARSGPSSRQLFVLIILPFTGMVLLLLFLVKFRQHLPFLRS